jgi:hypothetical protein
MNYAWSWHEQAAARAGRDGDIRVRLWTRYFEVERWFNSFSLRLLTMIDSTADDQFFDAYRRRR